MNCLDEGLLQAFIDGELSKEAAREAETHLAACAACADSAREAAQELALVSNAFAVAAPPSVPTERLRASLASAIAEMRPAQPSNEVVTRNSSLAGRFSSFASALAASLSVRPRRLAAFAGFALAAVVLGAVFFALRPGPQTDGGAGGPQQMAGGTQPPANPPGLTPEASPAPVESGPQVETGGEVTGQQTAKIRPKNVIRETAKIKPKVVGLDRAPAEVARLPAKDAPLLPGERQYLTEIASLRKGIERQKLRTLSPTLRAEYERNVAVVDEAIAATRTVVKSNPADRDAQEFLRAAYQNKLDLLSSVAGKSQLASADR